MFTTLNAKYQGSSENPSYDISGSGKFNPQLYLFLLSSRTLLTVIQINQPTRCINLSDLFDIWYIY